MASRESRLLRDKFGDTIAAVPFKLTQAIPSGKTVTVTLSRDYNQFNDEDRKLAAMDASSLTLELAPDVVLFSDGSKFEAPQVAKQ